MKKVYRSLALQFHPEKNQHSQVTEVIKIINDAKEELESTLRHNDEINLLQERSQEQIYVK